MKKEEFFEVLVHGKKVNEKLRRRTVLKRISLYIIILFGGVLVFQTFQNLYWGVFLENFKYSYWLVITTFLWLVTIMSLVAFDSYNPLTKIKGFNNQFFVLNELIILEITRKNRMTYNAGELMLLFKRYLHRMSDHAKSLFVFENDRTEDITNKLSKIKYSKLRSLVENEKSLVLNFFKFLNGLYEYKINERKLDEQEYKQLLVYLDAIEKYEITKPDRDRRLHVFLEFLRKKRKILIISLTVIMTIIGISLDLFGISDSKYTKYFAYISGGLGIIYGVSSNKDKD